MIVMVINFGFVSGLEITEVELNPEDADSGNEWVELFSEDEVNLDGFYFGNNDGDIYNISGNYSDYFVIEFDKQFLDNTEELLILYDDDDDEIDETDLLEDSENDDKTWSICNDEWEFVEETKDKENDCDEVDKEISDELLEFNKKRNERANGETEEEEQEIIKNFISDEEIKEEKIVLNIPNEEVSEDVEEVEEIEKVDVSEKRVISKQEKLRRWVVYVFLGFCVLLIVLLSLRKL